MEELSTTAKKLYGSFVIPPLGTVLADISSVLDVLALFINDSSDGGAKLHVKAIEHVSIPEKLKAHFKCHADVTLQMSLVYTYASDIFPQCKRSYRLGYLQYSSDWPLTFCETNGVVSDCISKQEIEEALKKCLQGDTLFLKHMRHAKEFIDWHENPTFAWWAEKA